MKPEEHIQDLFMRALEHAPEQRAQFLEEACGADRNLRSQLELLLEAHDKASEFMARRPLRRVQEGKPAGMEANPRKAPEKTIVLSEGSFLACGSEGSPRQFGDYELLEEIAHGGMGVVYRARQTSLNREVALKMILAGQLASEKEIKRFHTEAEAAANLDHPNIVAIYEVGFREGQHYFSMQHIQGRSLGHLATEQNWGVARGKEVARLMAKVARAVQYAHERGVLHRDLKPDNILIDAEGEPHVLDFGLARRMGSDSSLTMEGAILGTPSFMPPEQAAGRIKDLGPAADIYGLGAILYFLLTGRPPFVATSPLDTLVQVLEGEVIVPRVINPRVARNLEGICLRCLEKSPGRRYPSAGALAEDLERFVRGESVQARPPGIRSLLLHWARRQPALVSRLAGLAICLLIAEATFQFHPSVTLTQHMWIVSALGIWALLSVGCQWVYSRERWSQWVPYVWAAVDIVSLTVVLWLDEAMPGPLVGVYPVVVAASGLWFRAMVVGVATVLAMLGYSFLVWDEFAQYKRLEQVNWHVAFLVLLALAGCAVAYQVHRVWALSRFYRSRL